MQIKYGRRLIIFLVFSLLMHCAPKFVYSPDPKEDVKFWMKNLSYQKSFRYEYELNTAYAKISAKGDCIIGRAEYIKGIWDYGDTIIDFEYIGINDREWSKKEGRWIESARGEESNIYAQVKRILEFNKFELLSENDKFLFRSNATLPFLAPDRWREMIGYIEISRKTYLPEMLWVGLPDSSVYWRLKIDDYNHNRIITPPYIDIKNYEIKPDSSINQKQAVKKIKNRLKLLKLNWRLNKEGSKIILRVPGEYNIHDIRDLLAPGITTIYHVARNSNEASRISYLKGNVNQTIYLKDIKYDYGIIKSTNLGFDAFSRPYITIKLKKKIEPAEEIAIEIDSVLIATARLDKDKKMDKIIIYPDMEYLEILKYKAFMSQPLFKMEILPATKGSD